MNNKTPIAHAAAVAAGTIDADDNPAAGANADLDALQGMADRVDGETAEPAEGTDPAAQPINYQFEAQKAVDLFAGLAIGYCPPTAAVWEGGRKGAVAAALAPVLEKYGMTLSVLPVELVLAIVAGPALYQTAKIIGAQMQAEARAKAIAAGQRAASGTPGAPAGVGVPGEAPAAPKHAQTALYPA